MSDRLVIAEIEKQVEEAKGSKQKKWDIIVEYEIIPLKKIDTSPPFPTFSQILRGEHKTWIP